MASSLREFVSHLDGFVSSRPFESLFPTLAGQFGVRSSVAISNERQGRCKQLPKG